MALFVASGCRQQHSLLFSLQFVSFVIWFLHPAVKLWLFFCTCLRESGYCSVVHFIQMLEFHGDRDGARKVLTNYAYDKKFPSNPNAHIYLYSFLKRVRAPRAELLRALQVWGEWGWGCFPDTAAAAVASGLPRGGSGRVLGPLPPLVGQFSLETSRTDPAAVQLPWRGALGLSPECLGHLNRGSRFLESGCAASGTYPVPLPHFLSLSSPPRQSP